MAYRCTTCGQEHDALPDVVFDAPDPVADLNLTERETLVRMDSDTCAIDDSAFFIRGIIEIPVHGEAAPLGLGVWVSLKYENFVTYRANYRSAEIGPFFGWLYNRIGAYDRATALMKTMAHYRRKEDRPSIEIELTDHPLAQDQRNGITLARAWEIVHRSMRCRSDQS